jgi:hypothetical protein
VANQWPGLWTDLKAAIVAAWPDVTVIFRGTQVRREDWKVRLASGKIVPPYAIVELGAVEQWEEGPMIATCYMAHPRISYVMANSGSDAMATCEAKCKALQDKLQAPTVPYTTMQVWSEGFVMDSGAENEVMQVFEEQQMPFTAASLGFQAMIGETA